MRKDTIGAFLLLTVVFAASPLVVRAVSPSGTGRVMPTEGIMKPKAAVENGPSEKAPRNEYALPYPGILPDHPLYAVKKFRDYIFELLIVDPARKAEFYLLQADKRLAMGKLLLGKGNKDMAITVISEAAKYLEQMVNWMGSIKLKGAEVPSYLFDKAESALVEHQYQIEVLLETPPTSGDPRLQATLEMIESTQQSLVKLQSGANL